MALSAFDDKARAPEPGELDAALGRSARLWKELVAAIATHHAPVEPVWGYAGAKFGWSLRLRTNDRVVLYLIPQVGLFLVGVVLGERAVEAARSAGLPASIAEMLDAARPYAEGRGIRFPVLSRQDLDAAVALAALKLAR